LAAPRALRHNRRCAPFGSHGLDCFLCSLNKRWRLVFISEKSMEYYVAANENYLKGSR
jgi:hypothetical protein